MDCPIKLAAIIVTAPARSDRLNLLESGLAACTSTCPWWVGAGQAGNSGCAIAHLGNEAALKRYERKVE